MQTIIFLLFIAAIATATTTTLPPEFVTKFEFACLASALVEKLHREGYSLSIKDAYSGLVIDTCKMKCERKMYIKWKCSFSCKIKEEAEEFHSTSALQRDKETAKTIAIFNFFKALDVPTQEKTINSILDFLYDYTKQFSYDNEALFQHDLEILIKELATRIFEIFNMFKGVKEGANMNRIVTYIHNPLRWG